MSKTITTPKRPIADIIALLNTTDEWPQASHHDEIAIACGWSVTRDRDEEGCRTQSWKDRNGRWHQRPLPTASINHALVLAESDDERMTWLRNAMARCDRLGWTFSRLPRAICLEALRARTGQGDAGSPDNKMR